MGWFDRLLGRRDGGARGAGAAIIVRDGVCVIRVREFAERIRAPEHPNFGDDAPGACKRCGGPLPPLFITTGGPLGDPELWRDVPVAVDGWACVGCGAYFVPRKVTPEQIEQFEQTGVEHAQAGRFAEAEWWFARVVWDLPGYVPGHVCYAEAMRERLAQTGPTLDPPTRRRVRDRMRAQYEAAVDAYARRPIREFERAAARAYLCLAQLAVDDRAFDRARREVDRCLALAAVDALDAESARKLQRYIDERCDLFEAACKTLEPYLELMDRPSAPIDSPEVRAAVARAVEDAATHWRLAPDRWQAAWLLAKGYAALGQRERALAVWAEAWGAHKNEREIAREYSLALLRADRAVEALAVNRAICAARPEDATLWCNLALTELLTGDLAAARASLARSSALDPTDPVARAIDARLRECEAGAPVPRSLREMEQGR